MPASAADILELWFSERVRPLWFRSTPELDREIAERYAETWRAASEGRLQNWERTPEGALALVVVLDQFPLNMFRGRPEAYATEGVAVEVARRAVERGLDAALDEERKAFLYMPFMHSEDPADQDRAVELFERAGLDDNLKWARHHRELIRRFGRFPHRNAVLGRRSTPEEQAYLASDEAFHG